VAGEVDATSAATFGTALDTCNSDPTTGALDLSEVTFFSIAGVRCFVDHGWTTRPHPIVIASRAVLRVLTLCDLDLLLDPHGWFDHGIHSLVPGKVA
jgi:anti-anti-sigma regulatory factor